MEECGKDLSGLVEPRHRWREEGGARAPAERGAQQAKEPMQGRKNFPGLPHTTVLHCSRPREQSAVRAPV